MAAPAGLGRGLLFDGETGAGPRLAFVLSWAPAAVVCAVSLREMRGVPALGALLALAASDAA